MVRKPPIVLCVVFKNICFSLHAIWFFGFFGRGALGWLELAHRLSLCDLWALQSLKKLYHVWVHVFLAQDKCVSHGRSAFGGSCESFQELLSWWPWISEILGANPDALVENHEAMWVELLQLWIFYKLQEAKLSLLLLVNALHGLKGPM